MDNGRQKSLKTTKSAKRPGKPAQSASLRAAGQVRRDGSEPWPGELPASLAKFIALLTPQGVVVAANGAESRFSTSGAEGLVGQPIWQAAWLRGDPGTEEAVRGALKTALTGASSELEVATVSTNDDDGAAQLSLEPLSDEHGEVNFVLLTRRYAGAGRHAEDMLQAREHFSRTVLDSSPDCIMWLDEDGRIQFINAAGRVLLELEEEAQWRARPWWDLWPATHTAAVREIVRQALLGHTARFQSQSQNASGKFKWWDVTVSPVGTDSTELAGLRVLAVARDITEGRIAEVARGKLAAIIHSSSDAIVSKDLNSIITSWNEAAERIFGYTADEAIGQSILMLLPVNQQAEEVSIMERIHRGERVEAYDTRRRRKDGSLVEISVTISPIVDSTGRIVGASKIARDITDRKASEAALQETESRMRLATDATGVGIWEWHLPTQTIRWDNQLFKIYGMQPTPQGVVEYQTWREAVESEDLPHSEAILQDLIKRQGRSTREFRIRRRNDGQLRFIHAVETVRTDAQGNTEWIIGTNRDVTERMEMQQALTTADRRKDEFLATLAHELRNPLAPIRMGLEVLKRSDGDALSIEQTRAMIDRQLGQLVRLVDDLMDVSRISSGRVELRKEPVLIDAVLHSALESATPIIDKMEHKLIYARATEPLTVYADLVRLSQVFINLLNNAAKYTARGGEIHLSVQRHGQHVVVTVRDTGIGIAAEALPQIFDLFTQIKGTTDLAQGGLGIGLSLVKRLVELQGGQVSARSAGVGHGAEFAVRLPLYASGSTDERQTAGGS